MTFAVRSGLAQPLDSLWFRSYGDNNVEEYCMDVCGSVDGGYVLAGDRSLPVNSAGAWVLKVDATGTVVWSRRIYNMGLYGIIADPSGGYLIPGSIAQQDRSAVGILKLSESGDSLWSRTYMSGVAWALATAACVTQGGFALAGTVSDSAGVSAWLLKTDSDGTLLWSNQYDDRREMYGMSIASDESGNLYLAGTTIDSIGNFRDFWLAKSDATGNTLWQHSWGGEYEEWANDVIFAEDDGVLLLGYTNSFGEGENDFWVLRVTGQGDSLWSRTFGGRFDDECRSGVMTLDGDFVIAGNSQQSSYLDPTTRVIRIDSNGDIQQEVSLHWGPDGNTGDYSLTGDIVATADTGFVVATSPGHGGARNMGISKIGIQHAAADTPRTPPVLSDFSVVAYPNPFNSSSTVLIDGVTGIIDVRCFDVTGRTLWHRMASPSSPNGLVHVQFDASSLTSGSYWVQVHAPSGVQTRRVVLLK
jgi:hypothetical protein